MEEKEPIIKEITFEDQLSDHEKAELGLRAANVQEQITGLEAKKKSNNDYYNEEIKGSEGNLKSILSELKAGIKQVIVECEVRYNEPEDGKKTIIRSDQLNMEGSQPIIEDMTDDDFNLFPGEKDTLDENHLEKVYLLSPDVLKDSDDYSIICEIDDLEQMGLDDFDGETFDSVKDHLMIHFPSDELTKNFAFEHLQGRKFRRFGNYLAVEKAEEHENQD